MSKRKHRKKLKEQRFMIELSKLVPAEAELAKRTTLVEFKGIFFKIRYISRATLTSLAESCMVAGYDPKQKARSRSLNTEKFVTLVATTIVQGWENCTLKTLSAIMPVNLDNVPEDKMTEEIPFTKENLLLVIRNVHELDNFLQDCAIDASLFKPENDEELTKNSQTSQSGV